jgi:hypothetical protein
MNCKPGDLAIILGSSKFAGTIVEVLHLAPPNDFTLPNGQWHEGCPNGGNWVLRLPRPVLAERMFGKPRWTLYGCGPDSRMRPVSGLPEVEDTNTDQPVTA